MSGYGRIPRMDTGMPATWDKIVERMGPFSLQGMKASSNEWNVGQGLAKLQLDYKFQVSYLGGKRLRGGIVLDFLVLTVPLSTPLWVHGNYWHEGKRAIEDKLQQATLFFQLRGELMPPKVVWGDESETEAMALATLKREFNL